MSEEEDNQILDNLESEHSEISSVKIYLKYNEQGRYLSDKINHEESV